MVPDRGEKALLAKVTPAAMKREEAIPPSEGSWRVGAMVRRVVKRLCAHSDGGMCSRANGVLGVALHAGPVYCSVTVIERFTFVVRAVETRVVVAPAVATVTTMEAPLTCGSFAELPSFEIEPMPPSPSSSALL